MPGPLWFEQLHAISAGSTFTHVGTVEFASTAGNVTFGMGSNGVITASAPAAGTAGAALSISAGSTSGTPNPVVFSNSNGVSFGLNGSTITASVATAGPAISGIQVGASNFTSGGSVAFANSNGITFGMSGVAGFPQSITASHNGLTTAAQVSHSHALATTTTNGSVINVATSGSQGYTLGVPAYLTTAGATNALTTAAQVSHSHGAVNVTNINATSASSGLSLSVPISYLTAGANITLSTVGSTVSIIGGAGGPGGGGPAISGSGNSQSTGTVNFAASNGVTFGLSNNGTMTASFASSNLVAGTGITLSTTGSTVSIIANTAVADSTHSHGNPTLALTNLTGTTASASNGLTISLSAANPGGAAARPQYWVEPVWAVNGGSNALLTNITGISRRFLFMPFEVNGSLTFNEMHWPMSRATTGVNSFSMYLAIYSFSNSSRIDSIWSTSVGYSQSDTASVSGLRGFEATFGSTSLSPGQYVLGVMFDPVGASTSAMNYSIMGAATGNTMLLTQVVNGANTYHQNVNHMWLPFHGRFSVTTAAVPASVPAASVLAAGNATNNPLPMYWVLGTHYA